MKSIIDYYPGISFAPNHCFVWSPLEHIVFYDENALGTPRGQLALLHEIGHAELNHQRYRSDIALINMEVDAWEFARDAAAKLEITTDDAHIDGCLETYRVWLYKRSRCPQCQYHGIQIKPTRYRCFMCRHHWRVTKNLTLQPHRLPCHQTSQELTFKLG